jgi:hypothetical protein
MLRPMAGIAVFLKQRLNIGGEMDRSFCGRRQFAGVVGYERGGSAQSHRGDDETKR